MDDQFPYFRFFINKIYGKDHCIINVIDIIIHIFDAI